MSKTKITPIIKKALTKVFFISLLVLLAPLSTVHAAAPAIQAVPAHLVIPNAKVEASIIKVGVTPKGNLDVPNNYKEVGWYKSGVVPGQMGSAVIDGHVDNGGATPGPFKHLKDLKAGDDIYVTMNDGSILHYAVANSDVYLTSKFPSTKIFTQSDNKYLKIITCHGTFVPRLNTYDQRLVVTAVLVA